MSRREQLEKWVADVIAGFVDGDGETIDLIVAELRALWAIKDAAKGSDGKCPTCTTDDECWMSGGSAIRCPTCEALDAYEADNTEVDHE